MQTLTFLQLLFTSRWNCQSTLLQDLCSFAPCTSELFDKLCLAKLAVPFLHLHGYISYCFTFVVLHKQGFHSKVWLCIPIKLTSSFRAPLPLFQPSSQLSCMISRFDSACHLSLHQLTSLVSHLRGFCVSPLWLSPVPSFVELCR